MPISVTRLQLAQLKIQFGRALASSAQSRPAKPSSASMSDIAGSRAAARPGSDASNTASTDRADAMFIVDYGSRPVSPRRQAKSAPTVRAFDPSADEVRSVLVMHCRRRATGPRRSDRRVHRCMQHRPDVATGIIGIGTETVASAQLAHVFGMTCAGPIAPGQAS
jgi:hypothetical protein